MQFICDHGHTFHYPSKLSTILEDTNYSTLESNVCPFCQSFSFNEITDDKPQLKDVEAMIDIDAPIGNLVNNAIKEGYTVLESWQKNVRLVKYKVQAPKGETLAEIIKKVKNPSRRQPSNNRGKPTMSRLQRETFNLILNSTDGDYCLQCEVLKAMKPNGWT